MAANAGQCQVSRETQPCTRSVLGKPSLVVVQGLLGKPSLVQQGEYQGNSLVQEGMYWGNPALQLHRKEYTRKTQPFTGRSILGKPSLAVAKDCTRKTQPCTGRSILGKPSFAAAQEGVHTTFYQGPETVTVPLHKTVPLTGSHKPTGHNQIRSFGDLQDLPPSAPPTNENVRNF